MDQKATLISRKHFQDRVTNGVKKEECIVVHYKVGSKDDTAPQMCVLYPKQQGGDLVRQVMKASFLDEVVVVVEPHPEYSNRNQVVNVLPVAVPA